MTLKHAPFFDPDGTLTDRTTMSVEHHLSRSDMEAMLLASAYMDADLVPDEDPTVADLMSRISEEVHDFGACGWKWISAQGDVQDWHHVWAQRQIDRLWPLTDSEDGS